MLTFGVRAHDYGRDNPLGLLSRIAADGWQCTQLAPTKSLAGISTPEQVHADLLQDIRNACDQTRVSLAVWGAIVNPALPDEEARKKEVAWFLRNLPLAKASGAACIETETTPMHKLPPTCTREEAYRTLRRSMEEILPHALRLGVTVALEPVSSHVLNTVTLTMQLLRELACPELRIIFDPVNLLTTELAKDQYALWDEAIDCFGDRLAAVHIKGVRIGESGQLEKCVLEHSLVDYPYLLGKLKKLGRPLNILREEAVPALAKRELAYLKACIL